MLSTAQTNDQMFRNKLKQIMKMLYILDKNAYKCFK